MSQSFINNILKGVGKKIEKAFYNPYQKIELSWPQVRILKNLPDYGKNSITLFNQKIFFNGRNEFLHGLNEIFIDEIYKIKLSSNARIIDCGAHIGLSVIYFKKICPTSFITAFEPDEQNFNLLKQNIQSFQLNNIALRKEAVWITNTELNFSNEGSMASKIEANNSAGGIKVKAIRLNEIINDKIHLLKLDIEGAECEVMKDIESKLSLVDNIFLEYHGKFSQNIELIELLQILKRNQFTFYIKEAHPSYPTPFYRENENPDYDIQLNIFCFRLQEMER
jgi:FkbM family methyltransferase